PRMLTPVAVGDSPPATSAGSTTQHIQWGDPTQSASPGSVGLPDAPKATSKAASKGDQTVDALPKSTRPSDPNDNPAEAVASGDQNGIPPVAPVSTGDPAIGGKTEATSRVSSGNAQEPKRQSEGAVGAHSGDPQWSASDKSTPPQASAGTQKGSDRGSGLGPTIAVVDTEPVYHVGGYTLTPGGPAITIDNVPYSLAHSASALVSGTKTLAIARPATKLPEIKVSGGTFTADKASQYVVDSQTLRPDGPPITIGNVQYSIAPSATALISNGYAVTLIPDPKNPPVMTIGGKTFSLDTRPRITVQGQELIAGGPTATISNTPFALAPSGMALIAGSSTIAVEAHGALKNGGTFVSPNPKPGPQTVDLGSIINGPFTIVDSRQSQDGNSDVVTVDGTIYTADASSHLIVGTQTLAPGNSAITIGSQIYSLGPLPTLALSDSPSLSSSTSAAGLAVLTVASQTYTCHQNADCTIASQTLTPNGSITVSGDTVRYRTTGIDIIKAPKTQEPQRGEVITSHIDGLTPLPTVAAATTTISKSESGDGKSRLGAGWLIGVWFAVIIVWMIG
ncbi:MAG: hypothetical protein Q9181_007332, partial [Wetmoreana brouardii]